MIAALHTRPKITVETKGISFDVRPSFFFLFSARISVGEDGRGTHRLYDHDQPAALIQHPYHAFDDCLRGEWEAEQNLSRPTSSFEPFSPLDIFVPPIYHDTYLPSLCHCAVNSGRIDRRKLLPCCVSTKHFLLQMYRCSLHLQQPHSVSIIPPYIVRCFIFVSGSIDHWPWRLLGIETVRHLIVSNVACVEFLNGGLAAVQMGIVSGKRKASIHFSVLLALAFC
jgi:hypothetical protein